MHIEPFEILTIFAGFGEKPAVEIDQEVFGFGFVFFSVLCIKRPKPTDFCEKNRKIDRGTFQFRLTTLYVRLHALVGEISVRQVSDIFSGIIPLETELHEICLYTALRFICVRVLSKFQAFFQARCPSTQK